MARRVQMSMAMAAVLMLSGIAMANNKPVAMLLFGDSLSDVGNTFNATGGWVPSAKSGYWEGRFTNAPGNWVDYLSQSLNLTSTSYMAANGTNFAFGGATACKYNTLSGSLPTLAQQYSMYRQSLNDSAWAHQLESEHNGHFALVWGGHNDFLEVIEGGLLVTPEDGVAFVENTTACIMNVITQMVLDGEPSIVVGTLADVSASPLVREANMTQVVSALVEGINALIKQHVELLAAEVANTTKLAVWDIGAVSAGVLGNWTLQQELGFTSNSSCLVMPPDYSALVPTDPISICADPNQYTFYDRVHPSSRMHTVLAASAYLELLELGLANSTAPIPAPTPVRRHRASRRLMSSGSLRGRAQ